MRRGRRLKSGQFNLVYRVTDAGHARLGLAVSRKYGNAVARNRLKRVLRETFRRSSVRFQSVDILVIPLVDAVRMQEPSKAMTTALAELSLCLERN